MKRVHQVFVIDDDDDNGAYGGLYASYPVVSSRPRRSPTASSQTLSPEPSKQPLNATHSVKPNSTEITRTSRHKPVAGRAANIPYRDIRTLFSARESKAENSEVDRPKSHVVEREAPQNIIDIEDDEGDSEIPIFNAKEDEIIDLEDIEVKLEEEMYRPRPSRSQQKADQAIALLPRNPPICLPCVLIDSCVWNSSHLKAGKTVELVDKRILYVTGVVQNVQTDAISIKGLVLKRTRDVENMLPRKLNELCFIFEADQDDKRSPREQSIIDFLLGDVLRIRKLICTNKPFPECRFDKLFVPIQHVDMENGNMRATLQYIEDFETLVVRWKFTSFYKTAAERLNFAGRQIDFESQKLELLSPAECTPNYSIPSNVQRWNWRGDTVLGGSGHGQQRNCRDGRSSSKKMSVIELPDSDDEKDRKPTRQPRSSLAETKVPNLRAVSHADLGPKDKDGKAQVQKSQKSEIWIIGDENTDFKSSSGTFSKGDNGARSTIKRFADTTSQLAALRYTFGDAFCGAGGMTRGAVIAGLKIDWGFDFNANTAETWRFNFPNSRLFEMWANDFVVLPDRDLLVDILHLSPPCQVFSPIKVQPGKNDEMNFASLFAVREMIQKIKPRIVTLEQTFGILYNKYKFAFQALIHMFTDHGFSVSWEVVKFQEWGLAQSRRRLIIVAACPGEALPELPPPTHSEAGIKGLKRYTSIRSVLSSIPANAPNHETHRVRSGIYTPWDDSTITTCCMTSGILGRGHPKGERGLTQREFAAIQSFPLTHVFVANEIRKQIGNAVPPQMAAIILGAVKRHLERADKAELEEQHAAARGEIG